MPSRRFDSNTRDMFAEIQASIAEITSKIVFNSGGSSAAEIEQLKVKRAELRAISRAMKVKFYQTNQGTALTKANLAIAKAQKFVDNPSVMSKIKSYN